MNRMTDGITNYGALPGSIYDQPPEESEAVFVPPEFAGSFSTDSKYPTSRDSSSPNSGAHDSAATPTMSESLAQRSAHSGRSLNHHPLFWVLQSLPDRG